MPRHTQGCGGAAYHACDGVSLFFKKPRIGVLVPLSHPLLTQAPPNFIPFRFRANALNSHFSSYLPGFDPGSGASGALVRGLPGASGCLPGFDNGFHVFSWAAMTDPEIPAFPGHLQEGLASGPPDRPRSKGERSPRRGSSPGYISGSRHLGKGWVRQAGLGGNFGLRV